MQGGAIYLDVKTLGEKKQVQAVNILLGLRILGSATSEVGALHSLTYVVPPYG